MVDALDKYVEQMIKEGYLREKDIMPIKCIHCDSTNIDNTNYVYEEHIICEYDKKCTDCGKILSHWSYGAWEI